jgi:hypothetical protein
VFPWNFFVFVYYESRKRELKRRLMNEGRYDERLKARFEESSCLTYTGLHDKMFILNRESVVLFPFSVCL